MENIRILKVEDLMSILGIGRDKAYALMKESAFPSTKLGRMYFVTYDNFLEWLNRYENREFKI